MVEVKFGTILVAAAILFLSAMSVWIIVLTINNLEREKWFKRELEGLARSYQGLMSRKAGNPALVQDLEARTYFIRQIVTICGKTYWVISSSKNSALVRLLDPENRKTPRTDCFFTTGSEEIIEVQDPHDSGLTLVEDAGDTSTHLEEPD